MLSPSKQAEDKQDQTTSQLKLSTRNISDVKQKSKKTASPRLKKVKSEDFLKKRICSKMMHLDKLIGRKNSLCPKNV